MKDRTIYMLKVVHDDGRGPMSNMKWALTPGVTMLDPKWDPDPKSKRGYWGWENGNGDRTTVYNMLPEFDRKYIIYYAPNSDCVRVNGKVKSRTACIVMVTSNWEKAVSCMMAMTNLPERRCMRSTSEGWVSPRVEGSSRYPTIDLIKRLLTTRRSKRTPVQAGAETPVKLAWYKKGGVAPKRIVAEVLMDPITAPDAMDRELWGMMGASKTEQRRLNERIE